MQKFLSDTLESRYIKALLNNTELPVFPTVTEEDYLVAGMTYLYKNDIIRCTTSGYLEDFRHEPAAAFDLVSEYILGDHMPGLSTKFVSNAGYYDTDTHKALGHYLRAIRDIRGIDLMPLYNCYANEFSKNYRISQAKGIQQLPNDTNKVYLVPIKFNKTYTIAIDTASQVIVASAFLHNGSLLSVDNTSLTDILKLYMPQYLKLFLNTTFLRPFTYSLDLSELDSEATKRTLAKYEKCLYLMVQVPINCDSSFVVLEGDYSSNTKYVYDFMKVANGENILSSAKANKIFRSKLSLLRFNDRNIYAFADRLFEYLTGQVITSDESIRKNVKRAQAGVYMGSFWKPDEYIDDVWDIKLRKLLYDRYTTVHPLTYDILGYVDKDVESFIYNRAYRESLF